MDGDSKFCHHCGTPAATPEGGGPTASPDPYKTVVKNAPVYGVVNLEQLPEGHLVDDRYEVRGKLGQGGFGAVYRVFDRKMECDKALKVLPEAVASDIEAMENIRKEAVTMAKLNHPNIVRIFEFQDKGAIKYIDMEFVDGKSLTELKLAAPDKRLPEIEVKTIGLKIAKGLAYAHKQGVIHRDIKPPNILVNTEGEPKITDFGIAETVKSSMSRIANSGSSGTLVYMSPEQIRGKNVGRESDIYSFGVVLYELLTGTPPFSRGDISYQVLNEAPEPMEGISGEMSQVVMRCLEKEYQVRFRGFEAVLEALNGDALRASNPSIPEKISSSSSDGSKPGGPPPILKWGMGLAGLMVIFLGLFFGGYWDADKAREPVRVQAEPAVTAEAPVPVSSAGKLVVTTTPGGATVSFLIGSHAYQDNMSLEIGSYKIRVAKTGYLPQEKWVTVEKGQTARVSVTLKEKVQPGHLYASTTPTDAVVRILNIKPRFTPGMALEPGRYHLSVSRAGYETKKEWITLTKGQEYTAEVVLARIVSKGPAVKISNSLGMQLVYIKPGTFMMGSPSGESGRDDDERQHRVTLTKGYYLQTTEVTQGQWKAVMGGNPSKFKNCGADCPVEKVSWEDAQEFIRKLNTKEGGTHYRLPTEAEWEYASRAGSTTALYTGDLVIKGANNGPALDPIAWYGGNSCVDYEGGYDSSDWKEKQISCPRSGTHPVAQKRANAWGLYDMIGNVYEWCQDWSADYPSGNVTDPVGPSSGSVRVRRGGSWGSGARSCRSANRDNCSPGDRGSRLGFRLARTL